METHPFPSRLWLRALMSRKTDLGIRDVICFNKSGNRNVMFEQVRRQIACEQNF